MKNIFIVITVSVLSLVSFTVMAEDNHKHTSHNHTHEEHDDHKDHEGHDQEKHDNHESHEGHDHDQEEHDDYKEHEGHDHGHDNHESHESHEGHDHDQEEHDDHESHEGHDHGQQEHDDHESHAGHDHGHAEELRTKINPEVAQEVGIKTKKVSSNELNEILVSYGSVVTSPEQLSHVKARFPGLISSVNVDVGQKIVQGGLLAKVESNDSLRKYSILSPIDGIIIEHHANKGEFASDQVLFAIANFESLWVELRIYPEHYSKIKPNQKVSIKINDSTIDSKISHIIPVVDKPYQIARIKIDNSDMTLSPGMLVEGHIVFDSFIAQTSIKNEAIQTLEGEQGVFINKGNEYEFAPIVIGRSDNQFTEVVSGLEYGVAYVSDNSYLIKADIGKSEAEHSH